MIIRSVLSSEGKHAGIKHHLDEMVDLVPDANPLKPKLREIEYLAAYATTCRYPTAEGRINHAPSEADVETAIGKVETALGAAATGHGVDLSRRDVDAASGRPVR